MESKKLLKRMLRLKRIFATNKIQELKKSKYIIICIGTPINDKLNPEIESFLNVFKSLKKHISKESNINNKKLSISRYM